MPVTQNTNPMVRIEWPNLAGKFCSCSKRPSTVRLSGSNLFLPKRSPFCKARAIVVNVERRRSCNQIAFLEDHGLRNRSTLPDAQ